MNRRSAPHGPLLGYEGGQTYVSRGSLTVEVTPSKRSLRPVSVDIEVEDIEGVMKRLHESAPDVQFLDFLLRLARRL